MDERIEAAVYTCRNMSPKVAAHRCGSSVTCLARLVNVQRGKCGYHNVTDRYIIELVIEGSEFRFYVEHLYVFHAEGLFAELEICSVPASTDVSILVRATHAGFRCQPRLLAHSERARKCDCVP